MKKILPLEYTHLPLNEDVTFIAGYYTPLKEVRREYNGREVLYVVGQAVIDSSCCGLGSWAYVLVPGYVTGWYKKTSDAGLPVSEVTPVTDKGEQAAIRQIISDAEYIFQVEFW